MAIFKKNISLNMLRTLIIDDEVHVQQSLEKMLKAHCPNVMLLGSADGVANGIEAINKNNPELVLLDIKMDDGTGFDLLKKLEPVDFKVIFITAYNQYAIKAFKFSAIDYLLKPVDPEDLVLAINKVDQLFQSDFNTQLDALNDHLEAKNKGTKKIILRTQNSIHLVKVHDIVYCESSGSYTSIQLLNGQKILVSYSLKEYEDLLKDSGFFRVHKSYLVNMKYIIRFDKQEGGYVVLENESKVPVASRRRDQLLEMFERLAEI